MKRKVLWISFAICLITVLAVHSAAAVFADSEEKNGTFNGFPAHVDENGDLYIDETNFPDKGFREYIKVNADTDMNDTLSADEVGSVTSISISASDVKELTGIEFFISLTSLGITGHVEFDLPKIDALEILSIQESDIESLDASLYPALKSLYCWGDTDLIELDLSKNPELLYLDCTNTGLSKLDVTKNQALEVLFCSAKLSELDVSNNPNLRTLGCSNSGLSKLDVSNNPKLSELNCSGTALRELDVSNHSDLGGLTCIGNASLTKINIENCDNLSVIWCYNNALTYLDITGITPYFIAAHGQTYTEEVSIIKSGDKYTFDMADFLGRENDASIITVKNGEYDREKGIVTFTELPDTITYMIELYDTSRGNSTMDVTLTNIKVADTRIYNEKADITVEYSADKADYYRDKMLMVAGVGENSAAAAAVANRFGAFTIYDISLRNADGDVVQPDGSVKVYLPIPEDWEASDTAVYHITDDGVMTNLDIDVSDDGKYVTFETDHFSFFALVDTSTEAKDEDSTEPEEDSSEAGVGSPHTGDINNAFVMFVLLFAGGIVAFVISGVSAGKTRKSDGTV